MNNTKPKFCIGDIVYNKIPKQGSYEPSTCKPFEQLTVDKVEKHGNTFQYTCGYDGYTFTENELMSPCEYAAQIAANSHPTASTPVQPEMKDIRGTKLHIGDKVAYVIKSSGTLAIGTIQKFYGNECTVGSTPHIKPNRIVKL